VVARQRRVRPGLADGQAEAEKQPPSKMPCVYILINDSERNIYIGSSREDSAEIRLKEHNYGMVRSTKSGRPWTIFLYKERFLIIPLPVKKRFF
jgi:hypothetical protein